MNKSFRPVLPNLEEKYIYHTIRMNGELDYLHKNGYGFVKREIFGMPLDAMYYKKFINIFEENINVIFSDNMVNISKERNFQVRGFLSYHINNNKSKEIIEQLVAFINFAVKSERNMYVEYN